MGSNTEDTKLRTDRCVTESLRSRLTPLLTTNVSVTWSHLRPSESMQCGFRINRSGKNFLTLVSAGLMGIKCEGQIGNVAKKRCKIKPIQLKQFN